MALTTSSFQQNPRPVELNIYDAAGNVTRDDRYRQHSYDAAGRKVEVSNHEGSITQAYDGDGRRGRRVQVNAEPASTTTTYYLTASALGGAVLSEINAQGGKVKTNVYANGEVIATQNVGLNIWGLMGQGVQWQYADPVTGSTRGDFYNEMRELDPLGVDAEMSDPYPQPEPDRDWPLMQHGDMGNPASGCLVDGQPWNCEFVGEYLRMRWIEETFAGGGGIAGRAIPGGTMGVPVWVDRWEERSFEGEDGTVNVVARNVGFFMFQPGLGGSALGTRITQQKTPDQQQNTPIAGTVYHSTTVRLGSLSFSLRPGAGSARR